MHRGSSKGARETARAPEILPLSASPPPRVAVVIEITRGASVRRRRLRVPVGTPVRSILRSAGLAPEGSAVLIDETPVPLDLLVERPLRLVVVPTFSGG
jgi:sulfur carrier protein ThiS